jgi:ADP-ribose pyrophosphatase
MKSEEMEERTVSTEKIFDGRVISLQVDTVTMPNGAQTKREIVKHPGASAVLALIDGKLLVVEQYRKALGKSIVEIPAGKIDPGEAPHAAAVRELGEETGYRPVSGEMALLSGFYTSPGFANERVYLYFTDDVVQGDVHLDDDEFVEVSLITLEEALELMAQERICDAKTVMAVWYWQLMLCTGQQ